MPSINWNAISGSAECIGVIAVLASILYLARQVAQGNKLNQADSVRAFLVQYNTLLFKLSEPDMVEIWRRGTTEFTSLTDHEKSRLHLLLFRHFMLGQAQRMIDPRGSEQLSQVADFTTGTLVQQPGFKQWWDTFTPGLPDQDYIKRIENCAAEHQMNYEDFMPWFSPNNGTAEFE